MGNSFIDISSEPESLKQWEQVNLSNLKNKYMLAFRTDNSDYCELELIFNNSKLQQTGSLFVYNSDKIKYCYNLYSTEKKLIQRKYHVIEYSEYWIGYSDNIIETKPVKEIEIG